MLDIEKPIAEAQAEYIRSQVNTMKGALADLDYQQAIERVGFFEKTVEELEGSWVAQKEELIEKVVSEVARRVPEARGLQLSESKARLLGPMRSVLGFVEQGNTVSAQLPEAKGAEVNGAALAAHSEFVAKSLMASKGQAHIEESTFPAALPAGDQDPQSATAEPE